MRCSKCGSDNPEDKRFCGDCGSRLGNRCPKCDADNPPGKRFCGDCGAALPALTASAPAAPPRTPASGERRHLTVLFCDLVGSTEIAAQLDPEDWREVVAAYHRVAAEAITRFGGYVAKYLGDGVMAYFGWPEAHDNDGERAARAALAILDGIAKLNEQTPPPLPSPMSNNGGGNTRPKLMARVGIDSGAVVVGAVADKDAEVFGETPNIAARLQATATPGTVLITAATHRLISGLFVVEALGPLALKGITIPLEVFQVVRPTGVRGRLRAAHRLTPFVGREEELRLLLNRWERTREGEGQLALIIGEPGIGKSRLVAEFHEHIRDAPYIWMESAGEQFFENTPFHGIIEMLSRWLELQGGANAEEQCERLERALASAGLAVADTAPLIAELLQLPVGERYQVSALTGEQKRRRLLAALSGWVLGAARLQPLVMVIEDLHWLDPSTLELLQLLAEQGATVPLMLLYTARPEFRAPWPMRTHHSQITLSRLSSRNVREMVALVAAHNALGSESVEAVVERAVGVPLFIEELTRAVLESGSARGSGREIPATLHDSLMARLDRLGPVKEVIQIGAVIGREFSYGLLHAVHPIADEDLQAAIHNATDAELLYVRGISPNATYQFKHALIRDVAYEALLRSRRKELHARIAEALVGQFSEKVVPAPELLAHHYTEAGLIEQSIPYWQGAGERAIERSANEEAISHLNKGLELLRGLPETAERIQYEAALQLALAVPLIAEKSWSDPKVGDAYTRARDLSQKTGDNLQLSQALYGLWSFHIVRAECEKARELGEQFLAIAQCVNDAELLTEAHAALGSALYSLGEFVPARTHFEKGIALYDPYRHRSFAISIDSVVFCTSFAAQVMWYLGYPEQALQLSQQSLQLADQTSHHFSRTWALCFAARLHQFRGDRPATQECAEAAIEVANEQRFLFWIAWGKVLRGWVLTGRSEEEQGLAQMRQGLSEWQATDSKWDKLYFLSLLAEAYGQAGQVDTGLVLIAEALAAVEESGERRWEAEIHRLKGELLLKQRGSSIADAENCFQRAVKIARNQHAKSLELRATASLARLLAQQGRCDEARSMLAEIYAWFTEGFETADLKEANALLDKLAQ
ncbi:MAG: AAA family ATPase [Deltaproteobacteria bacterium]|nr:AAA family ATPase [Deltaproteobacteria bacterium]